MKCNTAPAQMLEKYKNAAEYEQSNGKTIGSTYFKRLSFY